MKYYVAFLGVAFFCSVSPVDASEIRGIPFVSQAPTSDWKDPLFQNACEEAVSIMADHWLTGKPLTVKKAAAEIRTVSVYEKKQGGTFIDRSARDTATLMREYFGMKQVSVMSDVTLAQIRVALNGGSVVIVPTNGRALKNPHFKHPGPETHMILIKGYDPQKKEFITNDPGTRFGENYRYPEAVLYRALRDYPTGDHLPIVGEKKEAIVIRH